MATLFAECERRGVRAIHLEVGRDNHVAKTLYGRLGFRNNDRQLLTVRLPSAPSKLPETLAEEAAMANATPGNSQYIALTTYRGDGRPVTTPVWSAALEGKLYVLTAKSTGKARRLRATGRVRFAACNFSGRRILGDWQEGTGGIVQDEARRSEALAALRRKYGRQLSLAILIYRLRGFYRERVVLELTPSRTT